MGDIYLDVDRKLIKWIKKIQSNSERLVHGLIFGRLSCFTAPVNGLSKEYLDSATRIHTIDPFSYSRSIHFYLNGVTQEEDMETPQKLGIQVFFAPSPDKKQHSGTTITSSDSYSTENSL